MLSHRAKVVVSKKDTKFIFLSSCCELTQAVVGQLSCRGLQELLRNQACQNAQTRRRDRNPNPRGEKAKQSKTKQKGQVYGSRVHTFSPQAWLDRGRLISVPYNSSSLAQATERPSLKTKTKAPHDPQHSSKVQDKEVCPKSPRVLS